MDELEQIKALAGVNKFRGLVEYNINDGSNISITGNEKGELIKNTILDQVQMNGLNYGLVCLT
jgi:hypothetical protein